MSTRTDKEDNLELFGYGEVNLDEVAKIVDDEESRWPEAMRQLYSMFRDELEKAGADQRLSISLLNRICREFGGVQLYLPRGRQLESEIQNLLIWHEFTGNNVEQLSRKYDKSMQHIYRVIAKMRHREVKKRQPDLF
ncbi:Mor transcription activator family protein [Vibrio gazogenes]|uniref:Transcriptional regulator, Middle operon regulator (Mor) family n=1 Tax=Vibrio gazogenes DSM 21264 = NBRC 103151 TaxID=1123492 RepID=A0A1M5F9I3_VIBGA|nr:Mor transcription activator family protein [Vibrio gazogenes]USP15450.1 transcriptional regulator [Vibrio gazogenes]SHF87752.1 Transcriptional regulator, Middle operon regulator (Mor) family [Vibrio gazogenes DSM 21264] [Vibrio gazogenes DSM 21264 = NBRC 103151]SJN54518.1 Mor transcription activator family protein [Vibrio gazogenes]HEG4440071.1 transcriptional regulator [Vibrio cholerae]